MSEFGDILVLGLGRSGRAAARVAAGLVAEGRARSVTAIDAAETPALSDTAAELSALGVGVSLGSSDVVGSYDVCIASPGIPPHAPLMVSARSAAGRESSPRSSSRGCCRRTRGSP